MYKRQDDPTGSSERRIELTDRIHGVWFGEVPGVSPGQRSGYRVHGAWRPDRALRHNPHKLVLDPYARAIAGGVDLRPEVYGHVVGEGGWARGWCATRLSDMSDPTSLPNCPPPANELALIHI